MLPAVLECLACPYCGLALSEVDGALRCGNGHAFDLARQGYVTLLPAGARGPGGDDDRDGRGRAGRRGGPGTEAPATDRAGGRRRSGGRGVPGARRRVEQHLAAVLDGGRQTRSGSPWTPPGTRPAAQPGPSPGPARSSPRLGRRRRPAATSRTPAGPGRTRAPARTAANRPLRTTPARSTGRPGTPPPPAASAGPLPQHRGAVHGGHPPDRAAGAAGPRGAPDVRAEHPQPQRGPETGHVRHRTAQPPLGPPANRWSAGSGAAPAARPRGAQRVSMSSRLRSLKKANRADVWSAWPSAGGGRPRRARSGWSQPARRSRQERSVSS